MTDTRALRESTLIPAGDCTREATLYLPTYLPPTTTISNITIINHRYHYHNYHHHHHHDSAGFAIIGATFVETSPRVTSLPREYNVYVPRITSPSLY